MKAGGYESGTAIGRWISNACMLPKTAEQPKLPYCKEMFGACRQRLEDMTQASSSEDGRSGMAAAAT